MRKKPLFLLLSALLLVGSADITVRLTCKRSAFLCILQALPIPSTLLGPPKGVIPAKEYARKHLANYTPLLPEKKLLLNPSPFTNTISPVHIPEAFVLEIPGGKVFGRGGLVITPEDSVISESAVEWCPVKHHSIFRKWKLPPLKEVEGRVAVIASTGGEANYFHWMFDVLPRLELLQRSLVAYDKIYLNPLKHPFQKETFKKLNIDPDKVIWAEKRSHLQADILIVPSLAAESGTVPTWVTAFLKDKFLDPIERPVKKRLYISRKNALKRKILNESELLSALQNYGFEEVLLEKLSVAEQAQLFAQAEWIVAPHGAGLTNLAFCGPGATLIEIFNPHYLNSCFWNITAQNQIKHHCIIAEGVGDNIKVDIQKVISTLPQRR